MNSKVYRMNTHNEEDALLYAHLQETLPLHSSVIEEHDTHDMFYQKWVNKDDFQTILEINKMPQTK